MLRQPAQAARQRLVADVPGRVAHLHQHQLGAAGNAAVQAVAQPAVAGRHGAGHQPVPLGRRAAVPAWPARLLFGREGQRAGAPAPGLHPGPNAVARLGQIGMRVKARVQQGNGDTLAVKARVGVQP